MNEGALCKVYSIALVAVKKALMIEK